MKIVFKGILRDTVLNIMTFNKLGCDQKVINLDGHNEPVVPFSHQIQRFQRFLLYCGIKTKNSKGNEIREL